MRLLKTNKPIPTWYLKWGLDQGAYDIEKLVWLPGNVRPVRRPDVKLSGMKTRTSVAALTAPPPEVAQRKLALPKPKPEDFGPGMYVPKKRHLRKVKPMVKV